MRFNIICRVIGLIVLSLGDAFSEERLLCTLTPESPSVCLPGIHVLINWKTKPLPHPSLDNPEVSKLLTKADLEKDLDEIGLASNDSQIFMNIEVKSNSENNSYEIYSKNLPDIKGESQTYVFLPEVCYSLNEILKSLVMGIIWEPDWKAGKLILHLRHQDGWHLYTIRTGARIDIDNNGSLSWTTSKIRRTPGNLVFKLRQEKDDIIPAVKQ